MLSYFIKGVGFDEWPNIDFNIFFNTGEMYAELSFALIFLFSL